MVRILSEEAKQRDSGQDVLGARTGHGIREQTTITSPVTPVTGAVKRAIGVSSARAETKRTVRFDHDAIKKVGCRKNTSKYTSNFDLSGPSTTARPCTYPTKPDNFDLSFSETASQSPPPHFFQMSGRAAEVSDGQEDDEDDGKETSPSPKK